MFSLLSAVAWVDFFTILLSKFWSLGKSLDKWYADYGMTAVLSDCLVIVLGIMLARFMFPKGDLLTIVLVSVAIQLVHDFLFYVFVIKPLPTGTNRMIDLFKSYSIENSWKILVADSIMIASTVFLSDVIEEHSMDVQSFIGLLGVYALTYVIHTKNAD